MIRLIFFAVVLLLAAVAGIALALQHYFGLFSMKSRVLRGAELTVHSIVPVPKPTFPEINTEKVLIGGNEKPDGTEPVEVKKETEEQPQAEEPEDPKEYVAVDMTIAPNENNADSVWEPGEFILTSDRLRSLMDLEDGSKEVGTTELVEMWDGSGFVGDDPGKYPGTQRLKVTFAVKPGTSHGWLHYYAETIGQLELPRPAVRT
jgi:hypothetical protein